jgi:pilus assembly protein Flp/PilA
MNIIINLWKNEEGAAAAEYALILAVVGAGIFGAAFALGGAIRDVVQQAADVIGGISIGS